MSVTDAVIYEWLFAVTVLGSSHWKNGSTNILLFQETILLPATERHTDTLLEKNTHSPTCKLSETRCCRTQYSTLLLGGGLFVLLSVWMLVGDTAAPRLPWGMPGIFPPGDTCIAASWAAYNCCKNKQKMGGGSGEREREEKHHQ